LNQGGVEDRPRARPLLTAALIVKDEERFLGGCLESVKPVVDEIVIVDTGSTDRSKDIARAHGARIIDHAWTGDFAVARNRGLDAARGRWILYIDADERLAPVERATLEALLAPGDLAACHLWFRPKSGYTLYREYRLFINDPDIRFRGIIHEKMTPDLFRVAGQRGLRIAEADLLLEHMGYDGPQEHKNRRNLPLLRAELALRPDNAYNWHHLGQVCAGLGDRQGALDAWRRSLALIRRCGAERASDWMVYVDLIKRPDTDRAEARALHREAMALFPGNSLLRFCGAMLDSQEGDQESAIEVFQQLAAIDAETFCDRLTAFDKRLFGEFAWAALGACHFKLGRFEESAAYFARAAAADPQSLEYRAKHLLAAGKAASLVPPRRVS
jgi:tetratricopeptide (TPR) repeat protein